MRTANTLQNNVRICISTKQYEESALRDANTARNQKKIAPPQTLFPKAQDGQNLISWR